MPSKKDIPKGKVQINVLISKELYDEITQIAPAIYGKYKGAISFIVEEALKQYLYPYKHAQIHTNPRLSVRLVYDQVIQKIKEIINNPLKPYTIPEKILDLAIMEVRGSDKRTINKWKNLFIKSGLIKVAGGFYPNRIYELM